MSGYTNFAIVGAGGIGSYIVQQLLKDKAAGIVKEVVRDLLSTFVAVVHHQGLQLKTAVQGDAKVIQVDYSNEASIKYALTGVDVVISTVPIPALNVQGKVAAAAREVGVKLFVPSEFGTISEGATEGIPGVKANVQSQLKALGLPYAVFYNGSFADQIWIPSLNLDVMSGTVSIGGDGNKQMSFTSSPDIARYVSYVLTHLPPEQLKNRAFTISGENKSFNEIFKAYEEKTGKKLQVIHIPVSEFETRLAANPEDLVAFLGIYWATEGPFQRTDNHLYPNWNPSPVIAHMPVA